MSFLKINSNMSRRKLPPAISSGFGQRMADFRKQRGITQVELAETLRTSQRAISYYETGDGYPPAPTIVQIAHALNVSTDQLLGMTRPVKRNPDRNATQQDPKTRRLWKKFQQVAELPEKDQRAVIRLINSIAKAS